MTEVQEKESFDFSDIAGHAVTRLRKPTHPPVDPAIVRQAQRAYDGVPHPDPSFEGELTHVLSHRFASDAMAAEFARQMRSAGYYTKPECTATPVIDPEREGDLRTVSWSAGVKKGRKAKGATSPADSNGQAAAE